MWAVYRNHTHVIDFLLENGADVNLCDDTGLNAFELATTIVHY
jgi:ankyrin repeat protein